MLVNDFESEARKAAEDGFGKERDPDSGSSSSDGASDSDTEDGEDEGEGGGQIMSIFASYYGIEDPSQAEKDQRPTGTIDDADFQADEYVKTLLTQDTFESLIRKDTDMVQEIRTLDGEMQKLVYDNYNKFIIATETIKEMKADVYGMDTDMQEVKLKMEQIAQGSQNLDQVLHPTRNRVDKLVRVRRLLKRLEFLNELPESLEQMIEAKEYTEAVKLYNKTISVLTRHSHVLSFKKIKERTEVMMRDLTGKVIDLLEDEALEAIRLTQYIGVLRLMKAPSDRVSSKLLSAHEKRSLRMVQKFREFLVTDKAMAVYQQNTTPTTSRNGDNSNNNDEEAGGGDKTVSTPTAASLSSATATSPLSPGGAAAASFFSQAAGVTSNAEINTVREFHQSMMVGLIEACKGIKELYSPVPTLLADEGINTAATVTTVTAEATSASSTAAAEGQSEKKDDSASQESFATYNALASVIQKVMTEYSNIILDAFQQFFERYQDEYVQCPIEYCDVDDISATKGSTSSSNNSQRAESIKEIKRLISQLPVTAPPPPPIAALPSDGNADKLTRQSSKDLFVKSSELTREASGWFLLARQAIVDVMYLDSNLLEVQAKLTDGRPTGVVAHGPKFSELLVGALTRHCDTIQQHKLNCYVKSVQAWLPRIVHFASINTTTTSSTSAAGSAGAAGAVGTATQHVAHGAAQAGALSSGIDGMSASGGFNMNSGSAYHHHAASRMAAMQEHRSTLQQRTQFVKLILSHIQQEAVQLFTDCANDLKPVIEMLDITGSESKPLVLQLISKFVNKLTFSMEHMASVTNNKCTFDSATNTIKYTQQLLDSTNQQQDEEGGFLDIFVDYTPLPPAAHKAKVPMSTGTGGVDSLLESAVAAVHRDQEMLEEPNSDTNESIDKAQNPLPLLFSSLLLNMLKSLMPQLNTVLHELELPTADDNRDFQVACLDRVQQSCVLMLESFVETNARTVSRLFAASTYETYLQYHDVFLSTATTTAAGAGAGAGAGVASSSSRGGDVSLNKITIPAEICRVVVMLDHIALLGCLIFSELPASGTGGTISSSSSSSAAAAGGAGSGTGAMTSATSMGGGSRASRSGGATLGIEMDIERMFSKKILIFGHTSLGDSTDVVLNTILKACFKAVLEQVRTMTLPFAAYVQIQAHIMLLKQAAGNLLRDPSECYVLVDQVLNTVFSRYMGANDIANASDANEMTLINRAIQHAMQTLLDTTVLIH